MLKSIDHVGARGNEPRKLVDFYTRVLGATFCRAVSGTKISTGEDQPHLNVFLRLEDGSMLDFMDAPLMKPAIPDPNTPPWVRHVAMKVGKESDLDAIKARVEAYGIPVDGPVSRGRNVGIYFYDPCGNRMEATFSRAPAPAEDAEKAWAILEQWEARKAAGEFNAS
jgi:catechol-2,3-dioxygenase